MLSEPPGRGEAVGEGRGIRGWGEREDREKEGERAGGMVGDRSPECGAEVSREARRTASGWDETVGPEDNTSSGLDHRTARA